MTDASEPTPPPTRDAERAARHEAERLAAELATATAGLDRANAALAAQEARLAAIIGSAMDAIITVDETQRIVLVNAAAERVFGYPADVLLGEPLDRLLPERHRAAHGEHLRRFGTTGVTTRSMRNLSQAHTALAARRADGSEFPIEASISQVETAGGRFYTVILRDVTERLATAARERAAREAAEAQARRLEETAAALATTAAELRRANSALRAGEGRLERTIEELQFANEELAEASARASAARVAAEEANAAKSQFLATMSHELRTPLNAIIGYGELLRIGIVGELSEGQLGYLGRMDVSARHLLRLIDEVLDLARVESGHLRVTMGTVAVPDVVAAALALVRPQADARGLALVVDAAQGEPLVALGDPDRVQQILLNLLANAVKFTGPGGHVVVRAARVDGAGRGAPGVGPAAPGPGAWVRLDVVDTGVGIPLDKREAVFEPFVQVEGTAQSVYARRHGGTGLGLTISRRLARLMDGELTVASAPGEGSTFTLWLHAAPRRRSGEYEAVSAQRRPAAS